MAMRLHTRVADDIRKACTNSDGTVDREREAEMRLESIEYANEVRGFYDEEVDPADFDEDCDPEPEDFDEE